MSECRCQCERCRERDHYRALMDEAAEAEDERLRAALRAVADCGYVLTPTVMRVVTAALIMKEDPK